MAPIGKGPHTVMIKLHKNGCYYGQIKGQTVIAGCKTRQDAMKMVIAHYGTSVQFFVD